MAADFLPVEAARFAPDGLDAESPQAATRAMNSDAPRDELLLRMSRSFPCAAMLVFGRIHCIGHLDEARSTYTAEVRNAAGSGPRRSPHRSRPARREARQPKGPARAARRGLRRRPTCSSTRAALRRRRARESVARPLSPA